MVAKNLLDNVLSLSLEDQIELFDVLRENLRNSLDVHPLTEEDRRILDERLADLEANPSEGSSWEEVEARVLASLRERP